MSDILLQNLEAGVLTLTMNRPDRLNALSPELLAELYEAISNAAVDPEIAVIVLTGAGRGFCAGGDVKRMAEGGFGGNSFEARASSLRQRMEVARLLHETSKPTIAMIRGPAAGAGLSLALACDFRVASDTARLTTAFAKVGLSGDFGGSWFLTRLVGSAKARELYLTSPVLPAEEANRLGLFTRLVADADLEAETLSLARSLADGPTVTLQYMKQNLNLAELGTLAQVMDAEALRHTRCADTDDHKEAATAFVEKRAPVFKGR
ncbi:MAG TPA: enoyl-CoA hydratase [Aliidongia sp.]|nr:enoyl-CoA hydratase [Aliidongia sp.]